ncbi:MAG: hypothetical protein IJY57_00705 [Clostridia bacterium]|nr:hypothetical protein [Clostridia bacterium]
MMEDFNSYANGQNELPQNLIDLVTSLAQKFDGKNQNDLLSAIYAEAKKGKKQGTLSNADIDNFARTISPLLDDKKRALLSKVVKELKKI